MTNFEKYLKFYTFRKINYSINPYLQHLKILRTFNLNKNSHVLDLGGNSGLVSLYLSDRIDCTIDVFEPHYGCFELLKRNFKDHPNKKKVNLYNCAVSNSHSNNKLYLHKNTIDELDEKFSYASSLHSDKSNIDKHNFFCVDVAIIDDVLKKNYDLIKIDIEGHEYNILPKIFEKINNIGHVLIELHDNPSDKIMNENYIYWKDKINTFNKTEKKFTLWK